ncbi:protein kinase domain-containing protein [Herbaspirillum huttiense]|uniref:protein kinase domain-containing protein n=1 Tax=Herbaspirillum huttiense TaxID=863372 RepID=UPI0021769B3C|nr:protein kinase [Herbaspirillum huttiense]UWE15237.1 protein kinase [Herbaspirillum huttiense]
MPELEKNIVDDITERLRKHLKQFSGYGEPKFLKAGGSAAVYRVETEQGPKAWKAFNPQFLDGESGAAERRRLNVQRRLINHDCSSLIQTFRVDEAENTAFVEMEFNPWRELKETLSEVPDQEVGRLIAQLVEAVKFLETKGIVHRDIKPENIHVSNDFKQLKLLDLGVARDIEPDEGQDAGVTDHGNVRPFLATAQYSSPEYLFRLDEPSTKLWKGLNFYQVGAVLHDLVMKRPLFHYEMSLKNRWLVARAVLTKIPSFTDVDSNRLSTFKALASRCLTKDLDARLQQVDWTDFNFADSHDPIRLLQARLQKQPKHGGATAKAIAETRLDDERKIYLSRLINFVRAELNHLCGPSIPFIAPKPSVDNPFSAQFLFSLPANKLVLVCTLNLDWQAEIYERTANVILESHLKCEHIPNTNTVYTKKLIVSGTIAEVEDVTFQNITSVLAEVINNALNVSEIEADAESLHCKDILK